MAENGLEVGLQPNEVEEGSPGLELHEEIEIASRRFLTRATEPKMATARPPWYAATALM